jgi:hypothetical protein
LIPSFGRSKIPGISEYGILVPYYPGANVSCCSKEIHLYETALI